MSSTRAGERSRYYNISFSVSMLASTLGPVVSIVIFLLHGNEWSLPILRNTFVAGLALEVLPELPLQVLPLQVQPLQVLPLQVQPLQVLPLQVLPLQ